MAFCCICLGAAIHNFGFPHAVTDLIKDSAFDLFDVCSFGADLGIYSAYGVNGALYAAAPGGSDMGPCRGNRTVAAIRCNKQ